MIKRLVISGKVQGVGFRYWLQSAAIEKNIFGWVKNKISGEVEALIVGNEQEIEDLIKLLKRHGVKISSFVFNIHEKVKNSELFAELYGDFVRETKELWETREDLIDFLKDKEIIKKYLATEMGNNEQLVYRSVGVLEMMEELHKIAFGVAKKMLVPKMELTDQAKMFFDEFESFFKSLSK